MFKSVKFLLLLALVLLLLSSCGLWEDTDSPELPRNLPKEFQTMGEVWGLLDRYYVEPEVLDSQKLNEGAIKGMLDALDDPYTAYLDAETYRMEISGFEGKFEGIGATIGVKDGQLIVIAPLPTSPAEQAGIRPGDKILEINGEPASKLTMTEAVLKIRGPKGTKVKLVIQHEGAVETIEVEIVRAEISLDSVRSRMLEDSIGHIKLISFSERTAKELEQALNNLLVQGLRSLILDLRDNPGGLLQSVKDVATQFLDGGVLLYEVSRRGKIKEWTAGHDGRATELPLAVLVNQHSASGSEVLAGALQDRGRAVLIGTTTFGKGSVNILYPLSDGSALYLTAERWLTPNNRPIEGKGLEPDYRVEITSEDIAQGKDPQLERAIDYLRSAQLQFQLKTATLSK